MSKNNSSDEIKDFIASLKGMGLSEKDFQEISEYVEGNSSDIPADIFEEKISDILAEEEEPQSIKDIRTVLSQMNLPQKVKAALFGNSACRAVLILDGNKLIQQSVLKNPKITDKEIESYSKNSNIGAGVLRAIADKRQWIKPYRIKYNLVCNPKTPIDVAIRWLRFLHAADLKKIARSKSVPTAVSTQAKKKIEIEETKKKGGGH